MQTNQAQNASYSILCEQWIRLLDSLNIGAFTADLQRRVSSINHSAQSLLGLQEIEVLGRDCREVFSGVPCMVKCLLRPGTDVAEDEPDIEIPDEDGSKHLITRLATPIYGPEGKMVGCLTILQDHSPIADLINRVHYEERSLKIILDNLDIGIYTVNRGGLITFFNRAAEKISGFDRRHVLGKPCAVVLYRDFPREEKLLKESMTNGQSRTSANGKMTGREGETIPVRANYMPLQNEQGRIVGGLVTLQDLTLVQQLDQVISERYTFRNMIGKDPSMQKIFEMAAVVAQSDSTVLIEGSTGTGKDLLAKVIHSASGRSGKPFVKVNCAAMPDNLLESELFGYARGAFTGAERDKPGRFQEADGGTIFLDEIGDLPLSLQAKLLRVLEDKEFYPLGSRHTIRVNVRIVSATNRGLEKLVARHLFREDLFYRLNVLRIELPPLKDRRADIPLLIRHILRRLCALREKRLQGISEKAMEILLNYKYPGNVRELENILEHALIICREDIIEPMHLPEYLQTRPASHRLPPASVEPLAENSYESERRKILGALQRHNWHRKKAAQALGIERTTLWRKMKRYGLNP